MMRFGLGLVMVMGLGACGDTETAESSSSVPMTPTCSDSDPACMSSSIVDEDRVIATGGTMALTMNAMDPTSSPIVDSDIGGQDETLTEAIPTTLMDVDMNGATETETETAEPPLPLDVGTQSATISREGRNIELVAHLPDEAGTYPLLIFAGGFQVESQSYSPLMDALAALGFVVVRTDLEGSILDLSHLDMSLDLATVLDWATTQAPFAQRVDTGRVGCFGHSLGGKLSVMLALAETRVSAVLAIDPVDGDPSPIPSDPTGRPDLAPGVIANLDVPFGLIGETTNGVMMGITPACAPLEQNFQTFFTGATGSPWVVEWTIPGADHMDFVWMCPEGGFFNPCTLCPDGTANPETVRAQTLALTQAFFLRHLKDDTTQDSVLTGTDLPAGIELQTRIEN